MSCRSRAIRSRSWSSASSWTRSWRRAFSIATPAALARWDGERLVRIGDTGRRRALSVRVEVAEDLVANADRHTEKGVHRRMPGGKPNRVGVRAEVVEAQRLLLVDDVEAEDP